MKYAVAVFRTELAAIQRAQWSPSRFLSAWKRELGDLLKLKQTLL